MQNLEPMPEIGIVLVQEDTLLCSLMVEKLSTQEDFAVLGSVSSAAVIEEIILRLRPDVVVLDLQWSQCSGLDILERITRLPDSPTVLALGATDDEDTQIMAARNG